MYFSMITILYLGAASAVPFQFVSPIPESTQHPDLIARNALLLERSGIAGAFSAAAEVAGAAAKGKTGRLSRLGSQHSSTPPARGLVARDEPQLVERSGIAGAFSAAAEVAGAAAKGKTGRLSRLGSQRSSTPPARGLVARDEPQLVERSGIAGAFSAAAEVAGAAAKGKTGRLSRLGSQRSSTPPARGLVARGEPQLVERSGIAGAFSAAAEVAGAAAKGKTGRLSRLGSQRGSAPPAGGLVARENL